MIDKSGEYWHFCFDETCTPNPTAIRETVQKMFDEMAEMGDCWFMRAKPSIEIVDDFEGDIEARIYCRFSAKPTHSYEGNKLVAVGLTQLTDADREKRRLVDFYRATLESIASLKGGPTSETAEHALMVERIPPIRRRVCLAFTKGLLGLHFRMMDGSEYPEECGPTDMDSINRLIAWSQRLND